LMVDKDAPLLLDSAPPKEKQPAKGPVADNGACHVCHTNYEHESLALEHARENVGCVKCHGESIAHRNDEDNITPPDIMFPADAIETGCLKCHETHDAPAKKVLARWQERCPAKENPSDLVCTDCHGEHRMRFRTVWWDKKTGKLARTKGERIKYNPDYTKKPGQAQPKPTPK
jgi:predicted CXXCH cytochrome family protein